MKRAIFLLFINTLFFNWLSAQYELSLGQWYSHLPYHKFTQLTQSESTIYAATEWSLALIDKEERSVQFISTVNGLANTGMGVIGFNKESETLVATYTNSEFDLIQGANIISFDDIGTDGNFTDRTINALTFDGPDIAYFATAFGVIKFNLDRKEFEYTADFGFPALDVAILGDNIYASTEDGIYTISKLSDINQQDFQLWTLLGAEDGFPGSFDAGPIEAKDGKLFLDMNDSLMVWENQSLSKIFYEENFYVDHISAEGEGVIAGFRYDEVFQGRNLYYKNGDITMSGNRCIQVPNHAIEDEAGRIWYADLGEGLRVADAPGSSCGTPIEYNSPLSHFSSEILVHNNEVYIASGGILPNGSFATRSDGVFYYDSEYHWNTINRWTRPVLEEQDVFLDFYRVAVSPVDNTAYFGTFWGGIAAYDGENFEIYNDNSSSLQGAAGDEARERIGGMAFDANNNLWVSNSSAPQPISVFTAEGKWKSFSVPSITNLNQVAIDDLGYKWFVLTGTQQGILVFDEAGTIEDTSDDRYRIITSNNSLLPENIVFCVEVDKDGDVWVGTSNGVIVFECGSIVFEEEDCLGSRRIVQENSFDDEDEYLLKGEVVNTIAIDPANRKWFGTSNGVFVQDANGDKQVAKFDVTNSPLFDNNIIDIAINDENGEVFIGTDKGVISYKSEAIAGGAVNTSSAYAYPNPVRPDYDGPIAIKGLAENANVKITDISGGLIYETTALGGQAIWDGKDYNGRKASTGVYLVFSTNDNLNNPDAIVTKILVVN